MSNGKLYLESCCTSLEEVKKACENGASRIELCERIDLGGITPSRQLLSDSLSVSAIPINVMIRPRGGNFVYSEEEILQIIEDIRSYKETGINGFVFGCLTPENEVDISAMKRLMAEVGGKPVTFHRAFDQVANPEKALEDIISLGCTHLLTSGNMEDAYVGRFNIARLVEQASGRITIIAGKGIRPQNLKQIAIDSKAPQLHGTSLF
ncbi:MAG: copper homeostasis protein CutC [Bacteroidales bacterium]|nr:copper homeostasis protein CutC [Bacteroidales bacterium]